MFCLMPKPSRRRSMFVLGPGDDVLLQIGGEELELLRESGDAHGDVTEALRILLSLSELFDGDHVELQLPHSHRHSGPL